MTLPRSRLLATLTILAVLGIGVVVGVSIDRMLLHRREAARPRTGSGSPFGIIGEAPDTTGRRRMRERIVQRMTEELTLTAAQKVSIDSIFARRELQLDSLRNHVRPALDSMRSQMRSAIEAVLTPEQRTKFEESRKKREGRRSGARRD